MNVNPKRILIVLPRQLGDVLLGTPLAQVLRQKYPNAQIDWWSHPMARQILEQNPYINNLFFYPILKKNKNDKIFFFDKLLKNILFLISSLIHVFKIRSQNYDVVIDAMNNPRTAILTLISCAKIRISFAANPSRNFVYNYLIPRENLNIGYLGHARINLLKPLGIDLSEKEIIKLNPLLPFSQNNVERVFSWLELCKDSYEKLNINLSTKKCSSFDFFILSPTHRHPVRKWPGESYIELAFKLIELYSQPIIWLWGPSEDSSVLLLHKALQEKLRLKNYSEQLSLFPPLFNLREAGVLSKEAVMWIGNSNGLSHVAAASGAKTLELHGPTSPLSWCHPNREMHRSIQRTKGCIKCESNTCKLSRRECLEDLEVNDVFQNVKVFLEETCS